MHVRQKNIIQNIYFDYDDFKDFYDFEITNNINNIKQNYTALETSIICLIYLVK